MTKYVVWLIVSLYGGGLLVIFFFAIMQSHLLFLYLRQHKKPRPTPPPLQAYPPVTIQLPIYNERYVVQRLLHAVDGISYPREQLQIQVLDDSTDATTNLIMQVIQSMTSKEQVHHIRRNSRKDYKAGALRHGLRTASGDFIALFDADFVPPQDFLLRMLPFFADAKVGFVQAPWGYLNAHYSLLTRLQAMGLHAHFLIEQSARQLGNCFIHFNGTAGVWRKSCILSAGDWSGDTLTEDIDLSYRAQMKGWRYQYVDNFHIPSELPISMHAIKSQYRRWNKGNMQNLLKHLSNICKAPIGTRQKAHALYFMASSSTFFLILLNTMLSLPLLWAEGKGYVDTWFSLAAAFSLGLMPFVGLHVCACRANGLIKRKFWHFLRYFPGFLSLSMSLSLNNSLGIVGAWLKPKTPFIRTPKWGISDNNDAQCIKNRYVRVRQIARSTLAEFFLFLYTLFGIGYGVYLAEYGFLPFHGLLCVGYGYIVWHTLCPGKTDA